MGLVNASNVRCVRSLQKSVQGFISRFSCKVAGVFLN